MNTHNKLLFGVVTQNVGFERCDCKSFYVTGIEFTFGDGTYELSIQGSVIFQGPPPYMYFTRYSPSLAQLLKTSKVISTFASFSRQSSRQFSPQSRLPLTTQCVMAPQLDGYFKQWVKRSRLPKK